MNVTHGLRRSLSINANGTATVCGNRRRTWREIGDRVGAFAGALYRLGVGAGDRVAILSFNSDRYLECYFATGWAGIVIVPLNIRWSLVENEDALRDCRPKALVVDKAFVSAGAALAKAMPKLTLIYADDGPTPPGMLNYEELVQRNSPIPDAMCSGSQLAGIFYTGGTTGRSKGVMLSHANLMATAFTALGEGLFPPTATYLYVAPMFHLASAAAMYSMVLGGGVNVIVPGFAPADVAAACRSERVTDLVLVPTMIQMLLDHLEYGNHDLSSVQRLVYGASPISETLLDRAMRALPHVSFIQAYGMTEVSAIATLLHWQDHTGEGRAKGLHRGASRAALGCEVAVVNAENVPTPPGAVGEIVIRGDNVMLGYWERPEETASALVDGWMHTGDGGYMDEDGYLYVVDRLKDMIISGGENVYSIEVENALARHPAVAQCAVIGIPSDRWGEQVHAVVVPKPGTNVSATELIEFSKSLIAGYKCPRSIEIRESPLPLSAAGKVLKHMLKKPFWEGQARRVS